jgi:hypothetical protein
MSQGADRFHAARSYEAKAVTAAESGNMELADLYARLADTEAKLAMAAAIVLTSTSSEAGAYRLAVGGLGI